MNLSLPGLMQLFILFSAAIVLEKGKSGYGIPLLELSNGFLVVKIVFRINLQISKFLSMAYKIE